ncbi:MAG: hypothetical protein JXR94_07560 [Candidatus Hydrogenedentes bacterium]|nr:hypothetical protein [Candidatus Hydrogenedentota bacterium]
MQVFNPKRAALLATIAIVYQAMSWLRWGGFVRLYGVVWPGEPAYPVVTRLDGAIGMLELLAAIALFFASGVILWRTRALRPAPKAIDKWGLHMSRALLGVLLIMGAFGAYLSPWMWWGYLEMAGWV